MAHAILSASGAERWMACTPSARLEEQFPNNESSYAAEGTLAHELAEAINAYNFKQSSKGMLNKKLTQIKTSDFYNKEMQDYIETFCDFVHERYNEAKAKTKDAVIALEERLDFSSYVPEGFGTGDVVIIADGTLTIVDLKYGKGKFVNAENNKQMMLYALGAIEKYDFLYGINSVSMIIYQPRIENITEWVVTRQYLMEWAETELKEKAALAYDGAGDYCPGGHCQFCRAKAVCRALAEENLKLAAYEFKAAVLLTEEEIADILKVSERLSNWAGDVAAYALDQAVNHSKHWPGWKLVEGRSNRTYADESKVAELLTANEYKEAEIYNKKLKGIGDMEKLVGKKNFTSFFGDLVIKPQGKPTLVPETDNRPEWNSAAAAAAEFAEVSTDDDLPY